MQNNGAIGHTVCHLFCHSNIIMSYPLHYDYTHFCVLGQNCWGDTWLHRISVKAFRSPFADVVMRWNGDIHICISTECLSWLYVALNVCKYSVFSIELLYFPKPGVRQHPTGGVWCGWSGERLLLSHKMFNEGSNKRPKIILIKPNRKL